MMPSPLFMTATVASMRFGLLVLAVAVAISSLVVDIKFRPRPHAGEGDLDA